MLSCLEQQVPILTGLDARPTCAAGCSEPSVNTLFKLVWLSQEFAPFQVAVWKIERRGRRDKGRPAILLGASTCLVWGQKKKSKAHNSLKSLRLSIPVQKSVFPFVTFYEMDECMRNSCCTLSSKKKETRRCRCDAACKATRKSNRCGNTSRITTVLPPSWWRENSI